MRDVVVLVGADDGLQQADQRGGREQVLAGQPAAVVQAARRGDLRAVRAALNADPSLLESVSVEGATALILSSTNGHAEVLRACGACAGRARVCHRCKLRQTVCCFFCSGACGDGTMSVLPASAGRLSHRAKRVRQQGARRAPKRRGAQRLAGALQVR
mgnify:CR=1 FL=1